MSIDQSEQLKRELTDKYVVVLSGVPELRRFTGYTGRVKTVNMSGRALVQFDSPVDIGWYDIEPSYLKVVDAPVKKPEPAPAAKEAAAAKPAAPAAKTAAATEGKKLSPLELARMQGAKKSEAAAATPAAAPAAAPAGGKKLSPLELARMQGAAKKGAAAPAAPTTAAPPAPVAEAAAPPAAPVESAAPAVEQPAPPPATPGKKLSPLELARQQGAFKKKT